MSAVTAAEIANLRLCIAMARDKGTVPSAMWAAAASPARVERLLDELEALRRAASAQQGGA